MVQTQTNAERTELEMENKNKKWFELSWVCVCQRQE